MHNEGITPALRQGSSWHAVLTIISGAAAAPGDCAGVSCVAWRGPASVTRPPSKTAWPGGVVSSPIAALAAAWHTPVNS